MQFFPRSLKFLSVVSLVWLLALVGGLTALVSEIFLVTSETGEVTGLSVFGGIVIVFAGISLAVGLSRMVVTWVQSLGN